MGDQDIIDQIQEIRKKNNENWMGLLRIAFRESPEESRQLMRKITEHDRQISELTVKLGGE
jgi:hypothetical protein